MNWNLRYSKEASLADFINKQRTFINKQRTKGVSKEFQSLADLDTRNTLSHAIGHHLKQCEHHKELSEFYTNAGEHGIASAHTFASVHTFAYGLHARALDVNRFALKFQDSAAPVEAKLDAVEHAKELTIIADHYSEESSNDIWNIDED